ncbi:MAG TPA: GNAT family N-acetyltransferase [Polyangiaceae bacterium]|jgi:GNAT superfamily N-acetyltransferase|nr:GNAT family N-acetyltransferase [Polyangiaceae bacterium]
MVEQEEVRVERARAEHAPRLAALLATSGHGCYCRYWHFAGNHREWLARCAHAPEENRAELLAAAEAGSEQAAGMVAEDDGGAIIGWLKLAPARSLGKIYEQRLYKGLPCLQRDPEGVLTVGCLFVREDARRRGVASALLRGAIAAARAEGARAIEAFPRSDTDVADAALMMGPLAPFLRSGFEIVHDFSPYPVLRLQLGAPPEARA